MANRNDRYQVGYGKPPKHRQFVKGQSGNPKGRPPGSKNFATILAKVLWEKIKVSINGKIRHISKIEAGMHQLANKATSGDPKALDRILAWIKYFPESEPAAVIQPPSLIVNFVSTKPNQETAFDDANVTKPPARTEAPNPDE